MVAGLAAASWYAAQGLNQGYQERRENIRLEEQIDALLTWINTHFPQALPAVQGLPITRTKRAMIYLLTGYGKGLIMASGCFSQPRSGDVRLLLDNLVAAREPHEPYAESLVVRWLLCAFYSGHAQWRRVATLIPNALANCGCVMPTRARICFISSDVKA